MMVTDRHRTGPDRMDAAIEAAASAGVALIQVRERGLEDADLLDLVAGIVRRAGGRARVVVNDRADVALAAGAAGVHLPAAAISAARLRTLVPSSFVVGRSVHSVDEAQRAERDGGCDYLVFGSVFETASKPAGHVPAGPEALAAVCAAVTLPVLAIGGISSERAGVMAAAGAAGIAAIGLFTHPEAAAAEVDALRRAFSSGGSAAPRSS